METSNEVTLDEVLEACESVDLDSTPENIRTVMKTMTDRDSEYYIPPKVWKQQVEFFGAEKMKEFIEHRRKQYEASKKSSERPNSNQPPVAPKQYNTASARYVSATNEGYDSSSDSESTASYGPDTIQEMRDILDDAYTNALGFMVKKSTTAFGTSGKHRLIFDTGADTSIIGKGWMVTHYYGEPINLIGFDAVHAKKKGLRA